MKNLIWVHLVFMSMGAILIVSAAVVAHSRKKGWFKRHRILALSGVVSSLFAFLAMETLKMTMHFPHLQSPHSIAGAMSVGLLIITVVTGMLIASGRKNLNSIHKALGRVTPVVMLATAVMGAVEFLRK